MRVEDDQTAFDLWLWPLRLGLGLMAAASEKPEIEWATPNDIVADTPTMRLRRFRTDDASGPPTLIVAPFAVHDAGIADLAPRHSLVERLAREGLGPIAVTEWKSATPAMRSFTIDAYLADLNVAVDLLGAVPNLVGLCQGGWLSLLYAAAFPGKARRLAVAGAPVDTSFPSQIAQSARSVVPQYVEELISAANGLVSGRSTLASFRAMGDAESDACDILQVDPPCPSGLLARYAAWDARAVNLPGRYYMQVLVWLFQENRLADGVFPAFGRPAPLSAISTPIYVLTGARDAIAPPPQALAALDLVATPAADRMQAQSDCGHLSLFMGRATLENEWREIAAWLKG